MDENSSELAEQVEVARREAARAAARVAEAAARYADARIGEDRAAASRAAGDHRTRPPERARPGEFVADELSVWLREQPWQVRCLVARTRRLRAGLPTVWQAFRAGKLDPDQVRVIDKVARRASEQHTLAVLDEQVVAAAQTRSPKQLSGWLLRLVVAVEPVAFEARHRRALAERRVTVTQGVDGIGYLTGEMPAADAAAIDALLSDRARRLGAADPRTEQQRRSDLLVDALLGRLRLAEEDVDDEDDGDGDADPDAGDPDANLGVGDRGDGGPGVERSGAGGWLEVEHIDPDTGELLGVTRQRVDELGEPIPTADAGTGGALAGGAARASRGQGAAGPAVRRTVRIGVVVPLSSLLGADHSPAELADRSGLVPGAVLRELIAASLDPDSRDEVLFTRLLTDDGGRLLDTTELGRHPSRRLTQAVKVRTGSCCFPTCSVSAARCDVDHHDPWPHGPTAAANLDPTCRRHHRAKTHAWLASRRDDDTCWWTLPDANHYRCDNDPLPTGGLGSATLAEGHIPTGG